MLYASFYLHWNPVCRFRAVAVRVECRVFRLPDEFLLCKPSPVSISLPLRSNRSSLLFRGRFDHFEIVSYLNGLRMFCPEQFLAHCQRVLEIIARYVKFAFIRPDSSELVQCFCYVGVFIAEGQAYK